mgnify:CR=1 FL=1
MKPHTTDPEMLARADLVVETGVGLSLLPPHGRIYLIIRYNMYATKQARKKNAQPPSSIFKDSHRLNCLSTGKGTRTVSTFTNESTLFTKRYLYRYLYLSANTVSPFV